MILQNGRTFHLQGKNISYIFYRTEDEDVLFYHFGKKLADLDYSLDEEQLIEPYPYLNRLSPDKCRNLSTFPQEYTVCGYRDMRPGALAAVNAFGNDLCSLKYESCRVLHGTAVELDELPSLFGGTFDTLEVTLADRESGVRVVLQYVVSDEYDVVARSARIENCANAPLTLRRAYSVNLDLPVGQYDLVHFGGDWGQERRIERTPMHRGINAEVCDDTGRSTRWNNPFVMLAAPEANETHGEVWGLSLIYSSNHSTVASMDCAGHVRVLQGISPTHFSWTLEKGEGFQTPQSVLCYSGEGFDALSQQYHRLFMHHLMRSRFAHRQRPVLINNWEATYFDFDEQKLLRLAEKAAKAGVELFVLDDGWFANRDNARSSLGDWVVSRRKLPSGLAGLSEKLKALGLSFGLWFEPECVSRDSDLYRAHPDWIVRTPQLEPVLYRSQYVLDLSRDEVCAHIVSAVSAVLESADISYVKWDMNRAVTDAPSEGFYHRYCLGFYRIVRALTEKFPEILFEGCASGGGRFDAGVLQYMPQIWTSDNSDAISRLYIQYATSFCYPPSTMGAHVSAVPNHQTGRVTPLGTRADVAMSGMFGYELDLTQLGDEELEELRVQSEKAKRLQGLVREGRFHRLRSPFETNECIWQIVSEDKSHVLLTACRILSVIKRNRHFDPRVKLRDLDENAIYEDAETKKRYPGSVLMHHGLTLLYEEADFASLTIELHKI